MIKEKIVLYPEPEPTPVYTSPAYSSQGNRVNSYLVGYDKLFSFTEIGNAIKKITDQGFKIGVYFQYPESKIRYYVKKFESRPAMVDAVMGGAGVLIGQKVGANVECAFSYESLENAVICDAIDTSFGVLS